MNPRKIFYSLSPSARRLVRRLYYLPGDIFRSLTGKRHKYEPPRGKIFIGSGDFILQGKWQLELLKKHAGIQPEHAVLDIGCGIGRTAVALSDFLHPDAQYDGIDIMKENIDWCNKKIHPDHPNFHFHLVDLRNDLYNTSKQAAENYIFPFEEKRFDTVFLFSVFTHMQPGEVQNYLNEIGRMLKPGGRCLATFFTYTTEEEKTIGSPGSKFHFPVARDGYRLMDEKVQSANVAFHNTKLNKMIREAGLKVEKEIAGFWKVERDGGNDFQDLVVLRSL